jgi:hypothetical protein
VSTGSAAAGTGRGGIAEQKERAAREIAYDLGTRPRSRIRLPDKRAHRVEFRQGYRSALWDVENG